MERDECLGLNPWSQEFVRGAVKQESGEYFHGMNGDEYALHQYAFADGLILFERVQARRESVFGLVFFLALQDETGDWIPDSPWSEAAIRAAAKAA